MKIIFATVIVLMAVTGTALAECSAADRAALEAFDRAWAKANEDGDRNAMMAIYADDFVGYPAMNGKTQAIDGAMRAFERNKANSAMTERATHDMYMISCTPMTATITHRNIIWVQHGAGGKPETFWTRSIHFLEKRNGKWQVVSNAGHDMDDYMTVSYLEQDWNNAFWKKDRAWFDANFASDFSSIGSREGALTGKADEIASIMGDKSTYDLVETTDMNVSIEGNTARVTGIFHLKGKDEKGAPFDTRIRYTDIWVKRDGRWMAWASQGTRIP